MSILLPIGWAAALLYGSLIPFDVNWSAFEELLPGGLLGVGLRSTSLEDVLINVLLYLPIGLFVVLSGATSTALIQGKRSPIRAQTVRKRKGKRNCYSGRSHSDGCASVARDPSNETRQHTNMSPWWRLSIAVLLGAAVSLVAENLQAGTTTRVASWLDVGLNTFGALAGAIIAMMLRGTAARWVRSIQNGLVRKPLSTLAVALTAGLLFYGLAPFDFVTSTHELHASFLNARWSLTVAQHNATGAHSLATIAGEFVGVLWYGLLGCLCALSLRESQRSPLAALFDALKIGFLLVGFVEVMQLFVSSHCFELLTLVLRSVAVCVGAWCGAFLIGGSLLSRLDAKPTIALPGAAWVLLVVIQVLAMIADSMGSTWPTIGRLDLSMVQWMPFEALWHRSALAAVSITLEVIVTYAALGFAMAGLFRSLRVGPVWPLTGFVVATFAAGAEALELASAGGTPDITGPVLALVSVLLLAQLSVLWPSGPLLRHATA